MNDDFDNAFLEYFYIYVTLCRISQRSKIQSFIALNFDLITLLIAI